MFSILYEKTNINFIHLRNMSALDFPNVRVVLLLRAEGERLDLLLCDGVSRWWRLEWGSLCVLSPGCVEVGTGLSSALSLLLIILVS